MQPVSWSLCVAVALSAVLAAEASGQTPSPLGRGAGGLLTINPVTQQAYIKASTTDFADFFGRDLAISGDTLVVGVPGEDSSATGVDGDQGDDSLTDAGAAYVFVRNGSTWTQQAYLKASNTEANDGFGISVAISGDTVVVGAHLEDSSAIGVDGDQGDNLADDSGAAYVFVRNGVTWSQQAYLKASDTEALAGFGVSVAVSDDTIVVGADVSGSSVVNSGEAYVFVRSGTVWSQQALLEPSHPDTYDFFGFSVTVSGDTIVIGALLESSAAVGIDGNESDNSANAAGAAYVFTRTGSAWNQQAYLKASNSQAEDWFGYSVSLSGDTLVVGALSEDSAATGVNGNQADNTTSNAGAAYVFTRDGTTWTQQAYLKASNTGPGDGFGIDVEVSGDSVVIGALREDSSAAGVGGNQADDSLANSGAAYVFSRVGTTWSQQSYLKASSPSTLDNFGGMVAASGETVAIGAEWEGSNATGVNGNAADDSLFASGAVYVFDLGTSNVPPETLDLTPGIAGSLTPGLQSFNETRAIDVTVLSGATLHVTSLTLEGLDLGVATSALVGARIYPSAGGAPIASSDVTVTSVSGPVSVPIVADLASGISYRVAFYVETTPGSEASAFLFVPTTTPYTEASRRLRINSAHSGSADAFPSGPNLFMPQIVVGTTWLDLGAALAGTAGLPRLAGTGNLSEGDLTTLALTNGRPNGTLTLVIGASNLSVPFKQGTLVPSPDVVLGGLPLDANGALAIGFAWPAGLPSGLSLFFQEWISDPAGPVGFAASNGLQATVP